MAYVPLQIYHRELFLYDRYKGRGWKSYMLTLDELRNDRILKEKPVEFKIEIRVLNITLKDNDKPYYERNDIPLKKKHQIKWKLDRPLLNKFIKSPISTFYHSDVFDKIWSIGIGYVYI